MFFKKKFRVGSPSAVAPMPAEAAPAAPTASPEPIITAPAGSSSGVMDPATMTATGNFKINMEALDKTLKEREAEKEERKRIVKKISDSRPPFSPEEEEKKSEE